MATKRHFPITAFNRILSGLYKWIAKLQPADTGRTTWRDYAKQHSYTDEEVRRKEAFVHAFAAANNPNVILDIGCNTGNYSKIALDSGVNTAIGFDFDQGAVELAFSRAQAENLNFLPLILDASNPSPSQGWAETERPGLKGRANADGLLALAIVHHLAIGKNVPLDQVVDWIISLAPKGVIEFVPKQDAMVQELLRLREDVFFDYSEEQFLRHVSNRARLVRQDKVSRSGRLLVWYERNSDDLRAECPRSDES
jgi:ribosomal protein L11 methylase PrmA